jgi:hypothetical protein
MKKPEGKRPLGRPVPRLENNIETDLRDRMGWYGLVEEDVAVLNPCVSLPQN